jgi:uncharacterized membrane protein
MSRATTMGIVLVVLGVAAFVIRQFTYTDREEILDIGPIEATAETQEEVYVPLWVGGVLLAAGVVLVAAGATHRG